ncbi:AAA family ATPase [Streptococcus suis]|uniref:AAA family ATPase n=1 Tax=Streptococcus suis TaxID=1307 RepID=UPI000CF37F23|nr:AAA family ATPase [Streptococcus suis]HEM5146206.1 AAA family ATPase [Streptococcus suis]HEM6072489.1 AAA family ATPase [Streptococcus suis]HEM6145826.1 AAA family ATPase [Streptococcus suis]HEM6184512.1 AAA family ATPase [Streptococcus suis]HEM6362396.1 AAA family ATPase [Streptococcus suis]
MGNALKFESLSQIADSIISSNKKVHLLYAYNATGKTRLSMELKNKVNEVDSNENVIKHILYFNSFTEDLFTWDNDLEKDEDRYLIYDKRTYFGNFLEEQQLFDRAVENFQKYVGKTIEIEFTDIVETVKDEFGNAQYDNKGNPMTISNKKSIRFKVEGQTVKVSRGEERIFIWAIFLTLLEIVIEELTDSAETSEFSNLQYIFIDDPISSLDDQNIINAALYLNDVIGSAENTDLKFIISTHQALFYNVLYNEIRFDRRIKRKVFHVMKSINETDDEKQYNYLLTDVEGDSPFGYHLRVREELRKAIQDDKVEKFHFALFRNLAEKTATFLGYGRWENVLLGLDVAGYIITPENIKPYTQLIDLYTHNRHADLEYRELSPQEKNTLIELFNSFDSIYRFKEE